MRQPGAPAALASFRRVGVAPGRLNQLSAFRGIILGERVLRRV